MSTPTNDPNNRDPYAVALLRWAAALREATAAAEDILALSAADNTVTDAVGDQGYARRYWASIQYDTRGLLWGLETVGQGVEGLLPVDLAQEIEDALTAS